MNDLISVYRGILPEPIASANWQDVLEDIRCPKYRQAIETARKISDPAARREYKKKLPAVTFCGYFEKIRQAAKVTNATGFIIPDLDHLPDVEKTFSLLCQDESVWFVFRSPSGDGLKCGLRAENISTDEDIKKMYASVERYFKEVYGIKIDPACKDISRLTFVSHDPELWINPSPFYFNIQQWASAPKEKTHFNPVITNNGWKEKYGLKVLESCCLEIQNSQPGNQHQTRLKRSKLIGGFIPEFVSEDIALQEIEKAVSNSGAKNITEAMKTVRDGIEYGKQQPIQVEPNRQNESKAYEYFCDIDSVFHEDTEAMSAMSAMSNECEGVSKVQDMSAGCQQDVSRNTPENAPKKPYNLAAHIVEWITNSTGSFTTEQIDREFCLITRDDKNNRAKCLSRCVEKKLVNKDKRIKGKYNVIDASLSLINILDVKEEQFALNLPFDLHRFCTIPKKAVIIMAGSSNAGKTALILNTLNANLTQNYEKYYLMSEMGSGEYVDRLRQFKSTPLSDWQSVKAAERSYDFNGVVEHHNKNGLTCIDFLEEVDGEYFKIATNIREIYDALGDGVALIAIQKKTDSDYARGGQATAEKARLYMAVDYITTLDHSVICALKIIKVKRYVQRNLQGYELHFKIHNGSQLEPISDWMRSSDVDRQRCKVQYERTNINTDIDAKDYVVEFRTDAGRIVGLLGTDHYKILTNYGMQAGEIMEQISRDSFKNGFLKDKSWYMQVTGIIAKKLK